MNTAQRFDATVEKLVAQGWEVTVSEIEGGRQLSANGKREWYDRFTTIYFSYVRWTSEYDGSKRTYTGGRFYAAANSAARRIDRKLNNFADLNHFATIYRPYVHSPHDDVR